MYGLGGFGCALHFRHRDCIPCIFVWNGISFYPALAIVNVRHCPIGSIINGGCFALLAQLRHGYVGDSAS